MLKNYNYRLSPNHTTERTLFWTLTRCRELYNAALSERKDAYRTHYRQSIIQAEDGSVRAIAMMEIGMKVANVSYFGQKRDLVEIKQERPEYTQIASHVLQDVLTRLDKAFQSFFRRVKNGDTPGYPRFQGRNRYNSFTYPDQAGWKLDVTKEPEGKGKGYTKGKAVLHLSKIGDVRLILHRPLEGQIKTATIKYEAGQWYAIFSCEVPEPEPLPHSTEEVGIDLGVTHLATLSNGEMIEHPRFFRRATKTLQRRNQALSRKKRGSHRREKARKQVAKAHRTIRHQRKDFLHKASRQLVNRYQLLVFEDIKPSKLTRKPQAKQDQETGQYLPNGAAAKGGLNKSILDAGWGMFVNMCAYKAEWAGRSMRKVNPAYTSQTCSVCGTVRKKDLSERWHSCECGAELDRDVNAAINILVGGYQQAETLPRRGRRQRSQGRRSPSL